MSLVPAIVFYDVVLFLHVAAIVVAFGVTFTYPVVLPWLQRNHPRAMATAHQTQSRIGSRIIGPFGTLALLTGIYMAADRDLFSETWVTVPMTILIIILIAGGTFFLPRERELVQIARRDLDAGDALSAEYAAKARVLAIGGAASALLVLIALFFMVVKP